MQLDQAATPGFSGPRRDTGSTARNREYRRRRREGLVIVPIEVKNEEIDTLVARGLVRQGEREDKHAVEAGIYSVLDSAFAAILSGSLKL